MTQFRKLIAVALLLTILVVAVAPTAAKGTMQDFHFGLGDPSQWGVEADQSEDQDQNQIAGDPSQWGIESDLLTRKVNEYEGQH